MNINAMMKQLEEEKRKNQQMQDLLCKFYVFWHETRDITRGNGGEKIAIATKEFCDSHRIRLPVMLAPSKREDTKDTRRKMFDTTPSPWGFSSQV